MARTAISGECTTTSDCLEIGDGVVRFCYEEAVFSNLTNFCDCYTWFGWVGENCDVASGALKLQRFTSALMLIYTIILMLLSLRTMVLNFLVSEGDTFKSTLNSMFVTLFCVFMSSFSFFLHMVLRYRALIDPSNFEVSSFALLLFDEAEFEDVGASHSRVANFGLLLSTFFQTISSLTLMLSWDAVIEKVSKFHSPERLKNAKKWTLRLKLFAGVYFLLLVSLLIGDYFLGSFIVVSFVSFVVAIFYLVVSYNFGKTFEDNRGTKDARIERTVKLVKKVCYITAVCLFVISLLSFVFYSLTNDYDKKLDKGQVNYALLIRELASGVYFGLLTVTVWYVNSVSEGPIIADDYPRLCFVFKLWDKKNTEMFPDEEITSFQNPIDKESFVPTQEVNTGDLDSNLLGKR